MTSRVSRRHLALGAGILCASMQTERPSAARAAAAGNLDDRPQDWQLWLDGGPADAYLRRSGGGLRFGSRGGASYAGIHAYVSLQAEPASTRFSLSLRFRYPGGKTLSPAQALEFTFSKWQGGLRHEWAIQWQLVDDGLPNGGAAPNWRLWTGSAWERTAVRQDIAPDAWHAVRLDGAIRNGQAAYEGFTCDGLRGNLRGRAFDPVPTDWPDHLSVAIQLNTREGRGWMDLADVRLVSGAG